MTIVIALASLAIALVIQRLLLHRQAKALQVREMGFRFHALRDRLQWCAAAGKVAPDSIVYDFLMFSLNVAIRNCEKLRLRDLLTVTRQVEARRMAKGNNALWHAISGERKEIRTLAGDTFSAFADMIIANDRIVSLGAFLLFSTKDAAQQLVRVVNRFVMTIDPGRAEVAKLAHDYHRYGVRLGT